MDYKLRENFSDGFLFLLRTHMDISERNLSVLEDYAKGIPIDKICNNNNLSSTAIRYIIRTYEKKCCDFIDGLSNKVEYGRIENLNAEIINNANIVVCISDGYFGSAIDKINKKIIQTINWNKSVYEDHTAECARISMERILGDGQEKLGSIFCKMLYSKADESCVNFLKHNDFRVWIC